MISPSFSTTGIPTSQKNSPKGTSAEDAVNQFEQMMIAKLLKQSRATTFEGVTPTKKDTFFHSLLERERANIISNSVDLKLAESLRQASK